MMDMQRVVVPFEPKTASAVGAEWRKRWFCAWRGASDRRYVASVYPVDCGADDAGLPALDAFVLLTVTRKNGHRRVVDITVVERHGHRGPAIATGLARQADEWHVYGLGDDPRVRAELVADLRSRHGFVTEARCA